MKKSHRISLTIAALAAVLIIPMAAFMPRAQAATATTSSTESIFNGNLGNLVVLDALFGGNNGSILGGSNGILGTSGNGLNLGNLVILDQLFTGSSTLGSTSGTTGNIFGGNLGNLVILDALFGGNNGSSLFNNASGTSNLGDLFILNDLFSK